MTAKTNNTTASSTTTASNTIIKEQAAALSHVLTRAVGSKILRVMLGEQYSVLDGVSLAAGITTIAANSDADSFHGKYLRMLSKSINSGITDNLVDRGLSVVSAMGDIKDADTFKESVNEVESAFNELKEEMKNITTDRFSTQQERSIIGTVVGDEKPTTEKSVVLSKGDGTPAKMPAGHRECERCHNPGKISKGQVLKLAQPELMPNEIIDLDGKWLCPKCLTEVKAIISKALAEEEARVKALKEKEEAAAREKEAAEDMEKLLALRAQEETLKNQLESYEATLQVAPEDVKNIVESRANEIRTSLGGVRMNIQSLENKINGTIALPAPKAPAAPVKAALAVAPKMTRAQRKAARKAAIANSGK